MDLTRLRRILSVGLDDNLLERLQSTYIRVQLEKNRKNAGVTYCSSLV